MWFIKLFYKLLGVYTVVNVAHSSYQIIKSNFKFKYIPRVGEVMYFEEGGQYYQVMEVIHYVTFRHEIWVIVSPKQ